MFVFAKIGSSYRVVKSLQTLQRFGRLQKIINRRKLLISKLLQTLQRVAGLCRVMYLCFQNGKRMIIIPDVHGRSFWRNAINEYLGKEPILFLGDYLDPYQYEGITPEEAFRVFHEIIEIKRTNQEAITLLLGNHDLHYLNSDMEGGRLDYTRKEQIVKDITDNASLFRIAESVEIGHKNYLFTHAGVKGGWIQKHAERLRISASIEIVDRLNEMWLNTEKRPQLLQMLADIPFSRWGSSPFGSPVWNDVDDIDDSRDEVPEYIQVFGHSQQMINPVIGQHFMCLDVRCAFKIDNDNKLIKI